MCASIREYGFKIPCLVRSSGEVVDGHLRLKAARKVGITEVPVILCDEWTTAQVKAFRLMVNRSATWAEFDDELLTLELQDLKEAVKSPGLCQPSKSLRQGTQMDNLCLAAMCLYMI